MPGWYDEGYFVAGGALGGYADYDADARTHVLVADERMGRVEQSVGRGRWVDVGCATGHGLAAARARGWSGVGVEASTWAAQRARARGFEVVAALDDVPWGAGSVDAVCFFQSLEHLPDPAAALASAARLLRPGGVVVCETWDRHSRLARVAGARWQQLSPPSVLWVLEPDSTAAMLRGAGLRPTSWSPSSKPVGVATVLGQVAPWLPRAALAAAARLRVRYRGKDLVTFVATAVG